MIDLVYKLSDIISRFLNFRNFYDMTNYTMTNVVGIDEDEDKINT